jgi:hypothetical protein
VARATTLCLIALLIALILIVVFFSNMCGDAATNLGFIDLRTTVAFLAATRTTTGPATAARFFAGGITVFSRTFGIFAGYFRIVIERRFLGEIFIRGF